MLSAILYCKNLIFSESNLQKIAKSTKFTALKIKGALYGIIIIFVVMYRKG